MTIREFWLIYDARIGEPKIGHLKESEFDSLLDTLERAQELENNGGTGRTDCSMVNG